MSPNFLNGFLTTTKTTNGTKDLNCKKMGLTTLFQFMVKHPVMERENAGYKVQWKWTIGKQGTGT